MIPVQCCSFPFTLNGAIYYNCTKNANAMYPNSPGCYMDRRVWVYCSPPSGTLSGTCITIFISFLCLSHAVFLSIFHYISSYLAALCSAAAPVSFIAWRVHVDPQIIMYNCVLLLCNLFCFYLIAFILDGLDYCSTLYLGLPYVRLRTLDWCTQSRCWSMVSPSMAILVNSYGIPFIGFRSVGVSFKYMLPSVVCLALLLFIFRSFL